MKWSVNPLNRFRYLLERQFAKGTPFQFLMIALLILSISVMGGTLVFWLSDADFVFFDAVWWAFLRLSDPGYLGDDDGLVLRLISTVLTVMGYVLFLGALVAVLTQWLGRQMRALESGHSIAVMKNHIVILGWTESTLSLLRELWSAESRVERFLLRTKGTSALRVVVLAEEIDSQRLAELRSDSILGKHFDKIVMRTGSALNNDHLQRTSCLDAAAIIVPARRALVDDSINSDTETIKVLLSLQGLALHHEKPLPYVVAEIQDESKHLVADYAYQGQLTLISSEVTIAKMMAHHIQHPRISAVYRELLNHQRGQNVYVHKDERFNSKTVSEVREAFVSANFCGFVRASQSGFQPYLNPKAEMFLQSGDACIVLAPSYNAATKIKLNKPKATQQRPAPQKVHLSVQNILVVGWSRKVPALIKELSAHLMRESAITLLSTKPVAERERVLQLAGFDSNRLPIEHLQLDSTDIAAWRNIPLTSFQSIVFVSSDRLASDEEADAKAIVSYLIAEHLLQEQQHEAQILIELSDPKNERLLAHRRAEVVVTPLMLSHTLVHSALRQELGVVFGELFSSAGVDISFRPPSDYGLGAGEYTYKGLQQEVWQQQGTLLGIRVSSSAETTTLTFKPDSKVRLSDSDHLVVLD